MFSRTIGAQIRLQCSRSLIRPSASVNIATSSVRFFAGWSRDEEAPKSKKKEGVINENIPFPNVRVVYSENGESKWDLLTKSNAIRFAQSKGLDLVLINDKEDPPVCKLENYKEQKIKKQMKEREILKKNKVKVVKEFTMGAGIEDKDIVIMMNKAKRLMRMGHPCRIIVLAKRQTKKSGVKKYHENPALAVEEVTLKMLETLEGLPVTIQPVTVAEISMDRVDGHIPLITAKKEFIISQKIDKKQMKPKLRKVAELLELDDDPKVKAIKKKEAAAAAAAAATAAAAVVATGGVAVPRGGRVPSEEQEEDDEDEIEGDEFDDDDDDDDSSVGSDDSGDLDDSDYDDDDDEDDEIEEVPVPPKKKPFSPRK